MTDTIYLSASAGEADINAAIAKLGQGGTIVFAKNSDITVKHAINVGIGAQNITIDLNGSTIHQGGTENVFAGSGVESPLLNVKLATNSAGNATITYDSIPSGLHVGSWVKVTSDDALPHDHMDAQDNGVPTRLGQAAKVIAINGNTVVLDSALVDQDAYQTNIRANIYAEGQLTIKNGTIDGANNGADMIKLRSMVNASVENMTFTDAGSGVTFVSCVGADAKDIVAINVGAGVHSATSLNTLVDGLYAETVGHGVMVHTVATAANSASASNYGADIGLLGTHSVVYGATNSAYDFHSESRNGTYSDVVAFNSRMFGDFRGIGNTMKDSGGIGNQYGLQFFEYGDGDGRNSLVDNLTLREIQAYTLIISNKPLNNLIRDSSFESYGTGYNVPDAMVKLLNTTIKTGVTNDDDVIIGARDNNYLLGGKGNDLITAKGGRDYVWGGTGEDVLNGGLGRDRFAYNALNEGGDVVVGFKTGDGGDIIDVSVLAIKMGWNRNDFLNGNYIKATQSGDSTLIRAHANDGSWVTLASLLNTKASEFNSHNLQIWLSDPTASRTEEIIKVDKAALSDTSSSSVIVRTEHDGTSGNDTFPASAGSDLYHGSAGNDSYEFNDKYDVIQGELANGGTDTLWSSVSVDLRDNANIEVVRLRDTTAKINATGDSLANTIMGNTGDNIITGGAGIDRLYGKGGSDTFVFAEMGTANSDNIWDFDSNDHIQLDKSVFTGLDANNDGVLDAGSYHVGKAIGAGAQIFYTDKMSGELYYDADGAGGQAAQVIAMIGKGLTFFDASDVLVL